jgi:hypothetical protein
MLRGDASADGPTEAEVQQQHKQLKGKEFVLEAARSRQNAFAIQPGAASGRSAGGSNAVAQRSSGRGTGLDLQARGGALGALGLKLLQSVLQKRLVPQTVVQPAAAAAAAPAASAEAPAATAAADATLSAVAETQAATSSSAAAGPSNFERADAVKAAVENAAIDLAEELENTIVPGVVECFCSRQDKLFVAAGKCLGLLRGHFASRPEVLKDHGERIAWAVLRTFQAVAGAPQLSQHLRAKASKRGLSSAGAAYALASCTRLLSALLNNKQSVEWFMPLAEQPTDMPAVHFEEPEEDETGTPHKRVEEMWTSKKRKAAAASLGKSTFFDALVLHIMSALDQPVLQSSALQLLRRVLLRNRVLTASVYQCIDAVGEVMITGADKRVAQVCGQIYVDFMLDYPHEERGIQQRLGTLARNLGYAEDGGRRAVLNCLYLVVVHFPATELEGKWSPMLFAAAAARLPQETDPTAH